MALSSSWGSRRQTWTATTTLASAMARMMPLTVTPSARSAAATAEPATMKSALITLLAAMVRARWSASARLCTMA